MDSTTNQQHSDQRRRSMKNAEAIEISRRRFAIAGLSAGAALLAPRALFAEGVQPLSGKAQSTGSARDQAGHEHVVRLTEADRCRPPQCWIRRRRPGRWPRRHSSPRLALRHLQLRRCCSAAGLEGLQGDRSVSARLRHHELSFQRQPCGTPSSRPSASTSSL